MRRPTNRRLACARTRRSYGWVQEARRLNVDPSLALDVLKRRVMEAILKEIYSVPLIASVTTDSGLMGAFVPADTAGRGERQTGRGRYIECAHYFDVPQGVAVSDCGRLPEHEGPAFANPKIKLRRVVEPLA